MATYLITQASGQQAGRTISHLLDAGAKIHALVRNPEKLSPVLQRPGVTVFKGESTDASAVAKAAEGCVGVFLNTFPIPGVEAQQARTIVDEAKKAGIKTIVAATTFCTGSKDLWDDDVTKECYLHDYYSSKAAVEDIVRTAGFEAYTILRPGYLHIDYQLPNVYGNYPELPKTGTLYHAMDDSSTMPHTDASDIGRYAAAAFQDPAKFNGQEIDMIHDNLTAQEIRDVLAKVSGRNVGVQKRTPAEIEAAKAEVFGQAFQIWANLKDFKHLVTNAKKTHAELGMPLNTLETCLEREKDKLLECLAILA
jgi:uncharacterized protein YbjT (DUF2867 family)